MNALLQIGLSNAVVCGLMTVLLVPIVRRSKRPALTHALCVLLLLKLLTPPLFNVPVILPSPSAPTAREKVMVVEADSLSTPSALPASSARQGVQSPDDEVAFESPPGPTFVSGIAPPGLAPQASNRLSTRILKIAANHWPSWLLAAWIASAVALGAMTLARIIRLALAVRWETVAGPDIGRDIEVLSKRLGIRRVPRVRFIVGSPPPMLLALLCRPELVIPIRLWDRLDHRQRETLLLHELAHLRRGDHWVRYLELLTTWVYWWHPAVWYVRQALHEAEEHCCDAWVIRAMPDSSRTYMATLLDAVDFLSQSPRQLLTATRVLASGMGQFQHLQRRLTMIRERNVQPCLGGPGLAAALLFSLVALPLGAKLASGQEKGAGQISAAVDQQDAAPSQSAQNQNEMARLEAELAAARQTVERIQRQLDRAKSTSRWQIASRPRARLGHIGFTYEGAGQNGTVSAFDISSKTLMRKLNVPLNADSVIQCYDNETLLIKSADGYTRLVGAEDGHVIHLWAPGAEAPTVDNPFHVNPLGPSAARSNSAQASSSEAADASSGTGQDQEKRMERMEESIRMLTEAVDRLTREQKEQHHPPAEGALR